MKKKKVLITFVFAALFIMLSLFIVSGFTKNANVQIINYSVSDEGDEITLTVGAPFTISYIRGYKDNGGGVKPHYLNFYNTFGAISSWGAKNEFVLELDEDDTEIYFNREEGGYELVLQKNVNTGEWGKPAE